MTDIWKWKNSYYQDGGLIFRRIENGYSERFYQGKVINSYWNKDDKVVYNFEKINCEQLEDWEIVKYKLQGKIKC